MPSIKSREKSGIKSAHLFQTLLYMKNKKSGEKSGIIRHGRLWPDFLCQTSARLVPDFFLHGENMKFTFSISRFHANSMAPIFPHVKTKIFKQYYCKYLVGHLHLKLYQFVYDNLNSNSLQYYFHMHWKTFGKTVRPTETTTQKKKIFRLKVRYAFLIIKLWCYLYQCGIS